MRKVHEDCIHDNDMIKAYYVKKESNLPDNYTCTLEDEMKPPALRPSVKQLIEEGRAKEIEYDMGPQNAKQIL